jgi:hypothetical protein
MLKTLLDRKYLDKSAIVIYIYALLTLQMIL